MPDHKWWIHILQSRVGVVSSFSAFDLTDHNAGHILIDTNNAYAKYNNAYIMFNRILTKTERQTDTSYFISYFEIRA